MSTLQQQLQGLAAERRQSVVAGHGRNAAGEVADDREGVLVGCELLVGHLAGLQMLAQQLRRRALDLLWLSQRS